MAQPFKNNLTVILKRQTCYCKSDGSILVACSGKSEKRLPAFIWSNVGCAIWEGFGGVALLDEVCHWVQGLWLFDLPCHPVCSLCFVVPIKRGALSVSCSCHLLPCCPTWLTLIPLEPEAEINSLFFKLPFVMMIYHGNRKATNTLGLLIAMETWYKNSNNHCPKCTQTDKLTKCSTHIQFHNIWP